MSTASEELQQEYTPFIDTPPFERPKPSVNREAPRYLFFIGNCTDPDRALELDYVRGGGIEVQNPCLKFTRQFIRRARITPLAENTHDPMPLECAGEGKNSDVYPLAGQGALSQVSLAGAEPPMITEASALVGWRAYPGDQINMILNGSPNMHRNMRRGIVEIPTLMGHVYRLENLGNGIVFDREIWDIQKAIFPDYPTLPKLLSGCRDLIDSAYRNSTGDLKDIAKSMLESCEQFGRWAGSMIERIHVLMRKGAMESGEAYVYSGVELVLLEQLGIPRQDEQLKNIANQTAQFMQGLGAVAQQQGMSNADLLRLMQESNAQQQANFLAALKELKGEAAPTVEPPAADVSPADEAPVPQIGFDTMMAQPEVVRNDSPESAEKIAEMMADTEKPKRPLTGFAKTKHEEKLAREAAAKEAE